MKTILIPTDFSEEATNALDVAHALAEKSNASLKLLHIIEAPGAGHFNTMGEITTIDPMDNIYIVEMMENMKKRMLKVVQSPKFQNIEIDHEVTVGNPFNSIAKDIADLDVDLVVMGSKGSSGLEETLIGSNTEKVVRRSKCPVLTVKSKIDINTTKNIVFASDFKDTEANVINALKKFQKLFDAKIHLLKVNTPNNFSSDRETVPRMEEFAQKYKLENATFNIYNDAVEEDGIIYFADYINADVIALATHGRSGFMHLLSGSIAEDVVNHAKRPVWTCRIMDEK